MRKFVPVVLMLVLFAALVQQSAAVTVAAPPVQRPSSLNVSLTSDPITIIESQRGDTTYTSFGAATPLEGDPGTPALPWVETLVGIPATTAPKVSSTLAAAVSLGTAAYPIEPMPTYSEFSEDGTQENTQLIGALNQDATIYRASGWYPADPVRVSEPFTIRGQSVVRVEYSPIQVNLATGEIRFIESADVTLAWATDELASAVETRNDPLWEETFAGLLSNYEEARGWRATRSAERAATPEGTEEWLIRVEGEGLFRIPLSQLSGVGVPTGDLGRLSLAFVNDGVSSEQAIWIDGDTLYFINTREHGFWSRQVTYHLTVLPTATGLRMAESPSAPTQGTTVSQVAYTEHFEEELVYAPEDTLTAEINHWLWDKFVVYGSYPVDTLVHTFAVSALVPGTAATVVADMGPETLSVPACYRAEVLTNGATTGEIQRTGSQPFNQVLALAPGQLTATNNTFTAKSIICPGTNGATELAFNAFDVNYQRYLSALDNMLRFNGAPAAQNYQLSNFSANDIVAFSIGQLNSPQRLTGGSVTGSGTFSFAFGRGNSSGEDLLVTTKSSAKAIASIAPYVDSGIRNDPRQTDWIVITHPSFVSAVQPLAAHRQAEGLTTRVVSVNDIYNDFGDGSPDPESIRDFLKFAYQNWNAPAPSYVLLMGDGTYDPLDYKGTGAPTWVPPIFRNQDIFIGNIPADNAFVNALDVGDSPNDSAPDMHIGRLTPNSTAEVAALVQKIITYENNASPMKDWRRSMLLVADDTDSAGNFAQISERIFGDGGGPVLVPTQMKVNRAYLEWDPDGPGPIVPPYGGNGANLRIANRIAQVLNKGALLVQYIGHGSPDQWAGNGLWTLRTSGDRDDIARLNPTDRFAFGLAWTCWEGYFVHTDADDWSMSEQMTRLGDRGFIGSLAPTGLDIAEGHDVMTDAFYKKLFGRTGETPSRNFGELTYAAKAPHINGSLNRLVYAYMLYGDPASDLVLPDCVLNGTCASDGVQFMPLIRKP